MHCAGYQHRPNHGQILALDATQRRYDLPPLAYLGRKRFQIPIARIRGPRFRATEFLQRRRK
jgi:hypothetical protein